MPEPYNPSPLGNPSLLKRRSWPETQLVKFIGRHTPKCPEVVRILSQGMDQKLTLKTRLLLNMHYLICRWCQRYSEHLRYLRKFSRRFPEQISNLDVFTMPADAKDRIKRKVGESAHAMRQSALPHHSIRSLYRARLFRNCSCICRD